MDVTVSVRERRDAIGQQKTFVVDRRQTSFAQFACRNLVTFTDVVSALGGSNDSRTHSVTMHDVATVLSGNGKQRMHDAHRRTIAMMPRHVTTGSQTCVDFGSKTRTK